jgi:methylthioribose-1-phosphate isomerase
MNMPNGDGIPIEQRSPREVTHHAGKQVAPDGVLVENPAFDVTPSKYIASIITERGIAKPPYPESLKELEQSVPTMVGAKR